MDHGDLDHGVGEGETAVPAGGTRWEAALWDWGRVVGEVVHGQAQIERLRADGSLDLDAIADLVVVVSDVVHTHRPVECVNVHCFQKVWCLGCDPEGGYDCEDMPWPCPTIRLIATGLGVNLEPSG
jgi:hypothetical protein